MANPATGIYGHCTEEKDMEAKNLETTFRDPKTKDMRPAVWQDKDGVMHRAVGANVGVGHDFIRLMWTACERKDIPANGAWLQEPGDRVDCTECLARVALAVAKQDEHAVQQAVLRGPGDG